MTVSLVLLPGLDGTGELFEPLIDQLPGTIDPIVISYPTHEPLEYSALVARVLEKLPSEMASGVRWLCPGPSGRSASGAAAIDGPT